MADRDPQIENIKDPKLQELARQARAEIKLDFGLTSHTAVNLETFAELVRQETRQELKAEAAAAAPSPKPRAP